MKELFRTLYENERPHLYLWSPIILAFGIAGYFAWPYEPSPFIPSLLFIFFGSLLAFRRSWFLLWIPCWIFLGFALASGGSHFYGTPMIDHNLGPLMVEGRIVAIEKHKDGQRFLLENVSIKNLTPEETPHRLTLTLHDKTAEKYGITPPRPSSYIQATALLLPLSEPMIPGGFDYRRNDYFRGIGATGVILGRIQQWDGAQEDKTFWTSINTLRQKLQKTILQTLDGDRAGLALIFLTGDASHLSVETAEAMRGIGLAHLLAIAGLHVGLLGGTVFILLRFLLSLFPFIALRFSTKKVAALFSLAAIIFYMFLVGAPVPTRRAVVMMSILLSGTLLDRISLSLRSVVIAALIILCLWPYLLFHPGFQLSFAAVTALVAMHEKMRPKEEDKLDTGLFYKLTRTIKKLTFMSFVATVATLPACLYHFQEAEIYSILANTLAIPLTSFLLMPLCVATLFLWPFGMTDLSLSLFAPLADRLVELSHRIAALPGAFYHPPALPISFLVVAYLGGFFFCFLKSRIRWAGIVVFLGATLASLCLPYPQLLVSPDGKSVGWQAENPRRLVLVSDHKADAFLGKIWASFIGAEPKETIYVKPQDGFESSDIRCNADGCLFKKNGFSALWTRSSDSLWASCAQKIDLRIDPVSDFACPSSAMMMGHNQLVANGAASFSLTKTGWSVHTERNTAAQRPWQVGYNKFSDGNDDTPSSPSQVPLDQQPL